MPHEDVNIRGRLALWVAFALANLGDIDAHFSGNFVDEDTVVLTANHQGFSTAAIGKLGPTLMFDHTERSGEKTITVDDSTGSPAGTLAPAGTVSQPLGR